MRMHKILGIPAVLIMGAAAALVGAPAQASTYGTSTVCTSYYNVTTCGALSFARQSDGNGVRLEGFRGDTEAGCGDLEDSGGRYNPVTSTTTKANGDIDSTYDFGAEPCNFYKDVSNNIGEGGCVRVSMNLHARVNLHLDREVHFLWELCPNGDSTVLLQNNTSV